MKQDESSSRGIRLSKNLLFYTFGFKAAHIINKNSLKINLNSKIFSETEEYFKSKEKGFYSFIEKFVQNKHILTDLASIPVTQKCIWIYISQRINEMSNLSNFPNELNRHITTKNAENFQIKKEKSILIQKMIRGFLGRIRFYLMFRELLREQTLTKIKKIQNNFRHYNNIKNIKEQQIIKKVLQVRHFSAMLITSKIKEIFTNNKIKKTFLYYDIINKRRTCAIKIQSVFRCKILKRKVKSILNLEDMKYVLTYPFVAKSVKLVVYVNGNGTFEEKTYTFSYCLIREFHVLYIDPTDFKCGKYRVKLIVDNFDTCDGRFPHIEFSDGHYYNIINFSVKRNSNRYSLLESEFTKIASTNIETNYIAVDSMNMSNISESNLNSISGQDSYSTGKVDIDLKRNLENKESKSYIEIIKMSVAKELNYNVDFEN